RLLVPRDRPSWPGGVAAPVRKRAKPPKWRRRGGGSGSKTFLLILNHHPVRSIKGSFAMFLLMSRPGQEGRSRGQPSMLVQTASGEKMREQHVYFGRTLLLLLVVGLISATPSASGQA